MHNKINQLVIYFMDQSTTNTHKIVSKHKLKQQVQGSPQLFEQHATLMVEMLG